MIRLSASQYEAIERHGQETYPDECCGFLIGKIEGEVRQVAEVRPAANAWDEAPENRFGIAPEDAEESQRRRYLISPSDWLRADLDARRKGLDVIGLYHSHPDAPARPSEFDREHGTWPGFAFIIVSIRQGKAAEMNAWVLVEDRSRFEALSIESTPATGDA
jgi:proteasome lid subunit RPN8/RPN11